MDLLIRHYRKWLLCAALFAACNAFSQEPPTLLATKVRSVSLDNQTIFDGFAKLSRMVPMSFAVERELTRKAYPVLPPKKRLTAHIENITLRGALDWLCGLDRRYSWSSDGKTINLFPSEVRDDPTYPLNQRIGTLKLDHISSIPAAVIQAAKNTSPPQQIAVLGFGETQYATPIDLRFSDITLREALNQIARAIGPTYGWQFSGTEDFHYMVFHDYLIPDTPAISSSANSGKK